MKPYYETENGKLYQGHALDILKALPDQSVYCCVTSPPYWGLRDYGTEPQIWDADPECDHVWGGNIPPRGKSGWHTFEHKCHSPGSHKTTIGSTMKEQPTQNPGHGQFCQKCGAWYGSYGLEPTPELYVDHTVQIFREVRRVLKDDGTLWLNLGDSYAASRSYQVSDNLHKPVGPSRNMARSKPPNGLKQKDLVGIPWRVALALQADDWYLRQDIIWHKPNPMPESVQDRCTKSHEYIFLLSKSKKYHYDHEAIKQPIAASTIGRGPVDFGGKKGRDYNPDESDPNYRAGNEQWGRTFDYKTSCKNGVNKRSVWTISTKPFPDAHFAVFPPALIEPCILAGCPKGETVLDPFIGSGTTFLVSYKHGRKCVGVDLSQTYLDDITIPRIEKETRQFKLF